TWPVSSSRRPSGHGKRRSSPAGAGFGGFSLINQGSSAETPGNPSRAVEHVRASSGLDDARRPASPLGGGSHLHRNPAGRVSSPVLESGALAPDEGVVEISRGTAA